MDLLQKAASNHESSLQQKVEARNERQWMKPLINSKARGRSCITGKVHQPGNLDSLEKDPKTTCFRCPSCGGARCKLMG